MTKVPKTLLMTQVREVAIEKLTIRVKMQHNMPCNDAISMKAQDKCLDTFM